LDETRGATALPAACFLLGPKVCRKCLPARVVVRGQHLNRIDVSAFTLIEDGLRCLCVPRIRGHRGTGQRTVPRGPPKLGDFIPEAQRSGAYTLCISCRSAVLALAFQRRRFQVEFPRFCAPAPIMGRFLSKIMVLATP
jgi:hypothetical protein